MKPSHWDHEDTLNEVQLVWEHRHEWWARVLLSLCRFVSRLARWMCLAFLRWANTR